MAKIFCTQGDATRPLRLGKDKKIIAHVCNDVGAWGAGFVVAISKRWRHPQQMYRRWYDSWHHDYEGIPFHTGQIQLVAVEESIWVANMIAQNGCRSQSNPHPLSYASLRICLFKLCRVAKEMGADVHMPRIGCGLAGGQWEHVEANIMLAQQRYPTDVYVYDLPMRNQTEGE